MRGREAFQPELLDDPTATVHVGQRLYEASRGVADAARGGRGKPLGPKGGKRPGNAEPVGQPPTDVVPGVPVAGPGVAQREKGLQAAIR